MRTRTARLGLLFAAGWLLPVSAEAHDLHIPMSDLAQGAARIQKTLAHLRSVPAIPPLPDTPSAQRRALGAAEIELTLGHKRRALEMLMGRLADPDFQALPEYVETLLFTSEILESMDEAAGAMQYAELALRQGGTPDEMAEAGARWFRLARRDQRLGRRLEIYDLWRARGGERASGSDVAAQVAYEVAFALRSDGRRTDARAMLRRAPSDSSVGSRAAYLAGVTYVEEGDLTAAERWFSAVMDWPIPALPNGDPRIEIERDVRDLASLATGRLRYERGDHEGAEAAYAKIASGSKVEAEVCWELAFLDIDRKQRRGALGHLQCVLDLGAAGSHHVDARLFRASLLAHLDRFQDSIRAYDLLHADMVRERDLFEAASSHITAPAEMLFSAMERSAVGRGRSASPGPATLFGGAWTGLVDQAYRVDRGEAHARADLASILSEVDELTTHLARPDAFVALDVRRAHLQRLLRELQHLLGHAGDLGDSLRDRHASAGGRLERSSAHDLDAQDLAVIVAQLEDLAEAISKDLVVLDRIEVERRARAESMLKEIRAEVTALIAEADALDREAESPENAVAKKAIDAIRASLRDAAMRAEVGILDTYWLKKEVRSQAIDELLRRKKEAEAEASEAIREAEAEAEDDVPSAAEDPRPELPEEALPSRE